MFSMVRAQGAPGCRSRERSVLAIELLAGAQAVEFLAPLEPGVGVRAAREFVGNVAAVREDRLSRLIERVATAIRGGSLVDAVEQAIAAPLA